MKIYKDILIVADKEEDGVLAHRSKGGEVAAGGFREQVAHPVGGEELARSCGEPKPEKKMLS